MYNGVIFDLDGVIVHTDKFHYKAWKAIADEQGFAFDETINNKLRGVSRMDSLDIILAHNNAQLGLAEKEAFATKKNDLYRNYLMEMGPEDVTDEVRSTLQSIRDKGIKTAIGSSSKNARLILERTQILDLFDAISDGNNINHSKPDPEVFLKAADFISENPADCLVVEDADAGVEAGVVGGFKTAAIGDATNSGKATYNLNSFSDLLSVIAE